MMNVLSFRVLLLAAGLSVFLPVIEPIAETLETATSFEAFDLTDTTEDPAYAEAGEALAKTAAEGVIGEPAPLAVMKTIDGQQIDLTQIYGKKPVYIKFWATWCTPCRQQMPGFEATYKALGDQMEIIAINIGFSEDERSVRVFRDKYGLTMPIVIDDGMLAKQFHLNVTPQHVLIGRDGRFAYIGHAENEDLERAIQRAVAEPYEGDMATATTTEIDPLIRVGSMVPELAVTRLNGERFPLQASKGRILAIEFFSSWGEWYLETSRPETAKACARVREEIETMSSESISIDWIGISGGPWATEQDLADYKANNQISIPLALDESNTLFRMFGVRDIPTVALIDDAGKLIGLIGPDQTNLTSAIQSVIGSTQPTHEY